MKKKENEVLYFTLMWKRKTGVSFFFIILSFFPTLLILIIFKLIIFNTEVE